MSTENEAIWDGWFSVAEPLNKFIVWIVIAIVALVNIITIVLAIPALPWTTSTIVVAIIYLCCGIAGAILYLLMIQKNVAEKDLNKKMYIFFFVVLVLVFIGSYWAGLVMALQFVMVGILSEKPFWVAFQE